ncbi:MAG: ATP-grasp domain-containing protein [Gemmataceae bacterium]|nr:ATP-grasp domain-containing protein [Gemmataceae bacterium]MCI0742920.1 ATP-grasp domain-containing protein [Gemmataceae bacterium]
MNVLILSATASAINYQKALAGRRDLRLFFADASRYAGGLYGAGVTPLLLPRARSLDRYQEALDAAIKRHGIDLLIPTSDHDMEGVMELQRRGWTPPVSMFRPDYDIYRTLTHKALLMQALAEKGFETPRVYSRPDEVEFPAVVKPCREGGSKGVWIVHDRAELHDRLNQVRHSFKGDVVLQQYIPGDTGSIYVALLLFGQDGKLYGEAASHSHLTFMTWGGGGNAGAVVEEPELLDQAKRIIAALGGWRGPVNLEFKRHEQNRRFYLLEVNCRLNGYSYVYTMNGMNFPAAVVDLLQKQRTEFLRLRPDEPRRNFVVGFRECPVEDWCDDAA